MSDAMTYGEIRRLMDALTRLREGVAQAMGCEPEDDDDLVEAVRLLVSERDEARAHTSTAAFMRVERQRDEARAQVKAWQAEELARRTERDEARAEVERLRALLDAYSTGDE